MRALGIAVLSVIASCCGTLVYAAATQVNITDPTATTRGAKVEPGNRLAVQEVAPTTYFHYATIGVPTDGCKTVATTPSGKALIVRQVRTNVFGTVTNNYFGLYVGAGCPFSGIVSDVEPAVSGQNTVTFDPGVVIPSGSVLSALNGGPGGMTLNVYVDGYTVATSVAPAASQMIEVHGRMPTAR